MLKRLKGDMPNIGDQDQQDLQQMILRKYEFSGWTLQW